MQQGCNGAALEHGKVVQQWRARGKGSAIGGVRGRSRRGTREVGAVLGIEREIEEREMGSGRGHRARASSPGGARLARGGRDGRWGSGCGTRVRKRDWEAGRPGLRPKWPAGLLSLSHSFVFLKNRELKERKKDRGEG